MIANYSKIVPAAELQAGELIRFSFDSTSTLGFCLGAREAEQPFRVLLLSPTRRIPQVPAIVSPQLSDHVISFGSEWVLEVVDTDDSWVGNHEHSERPGTVLASADGYGMLYLELSGFREVVRIDLQHWQIEGGGECAPFIKWRLWVNQTQMDRHGADPLIVFDATRAPQGET